MKHQHSTEAPLGRTRAREVVAALRDAEHLETAVEHLLEHGVDRADLDLVAGPQWPVTIRREIVTAADAANASAVTIGSTMGLGALGAAALAVAGGVSVPALAASIIAGGLTGVGIGAALAKRVADRRQARLDFDLSCDRLRLAVRAHGPASEARLTELLRGAGTRDVETRDAVIERRIDDVPLARLNPDPWLGREKIGTV